VAERQWHTGIWLMNGMNVVSMGAAGSFNPGPSWQIKDTGDFNGDGKSDILWQGSDGTPAIWLMDGTNAVTVGAHWSPCKAALTLFLSASDPKISEEFW
jgi:hypothetical protein